MSTRPWLERRARRLRRPLIRRVGARVDTKIELAANRKANSGDGALVSWNRN
jgi:hypothetical protein